MPEQKNNQFPIYGQHPVKEYIRALRSIQHKDSVLFNKVLASFHFLRSKGSESTADRMPVEAQELIKEFSLEIDIQHASYLNKITEPHSNQGVILFTDYPVLHSLSEKKFWDLFTSDARILILDHITDIQNFSAICRNAAALGVDFIVQGQDGSCSITPAVHRISAGAFSWIQLVTVSNLHPFLQKISESEIPVLLTVTDFDAENIFRWQPTSLRARGYALVMGNEEKGIRKSFRKLKVRKIRLPMDYKIQSLNVAHATTSFLSLLHYFIEASGNVD